MATYAILSIEVNEKHQTMKIFDGKTSVFVWCGEAHQAVQTHAGAEMPCWMNRAGGKNFWAKSRDEFFSAALSAYKRPAIRAMLEFARDEFARIEAKAA
jgi:hypothetical protein